MVRELKLAVELQQGTAELMLLTLEGISGHGPLALPMFPVIIG